MVRVESLHVYPVKSCKGISLQVATVGPRGFKYDRNWIVVDANGKMLTQRDVPKMATLTVEVTPPDDDPDLITFSADGIYDITKVADNLFGDKATVDVWGNECAGIDQGEEFAEFFSEALGVKCRLLQFDESSFRDLDAEWIGDTKATAAFSDVLPFLVVNTASLDALNEMRATRDMPPCNIDQFRANIVLSGLEAWEEDEIPALQIGDVKIDLTRPCNRCRVPSIDQQTGVEEDYGNLEVLAEERKFKNYVNGSGAMFGVQGLCTRGEGKAIIVGDEAKVVEQTASLPAAPRLFS